MKRTNPIPVLLFAVACSGPSHRAGENVILTDPLRITVRDADTLDSVTFGFTDDQLEALQALYRWIEVRTPLGNAVCDLHNNPGRQTAWPGLQYPEARVLETSKPHPVIVAGITDDGRVEILHERPRLDWEELVAHPIRILHARLLQEQPLDSQGSDRPIDLLRIVVTAEQVKSLRQEFAYLEIKVWGASLIRKSLEFWPPLLLMTLRPHNADGGIDRIIEVKPWSNFSEGVSVKSIAFLAAKTVYKEE
ncbi:MAG: hypothetical protein HYY16_07750 [Planctomycetes bacterium]|nr:hypothetical protein [Planctomycetota bacterium]